MNKLENIQNNFNNDSLKHKSFTEKIFESKTTWFLIGFLVFCFLLEMIFLVPNPELFQKFMTHQSHFTNGNYTSVLTSIFLHGGIIHLLTNCLALLIFGRKVEKHLKGWKMILFFISGGVLSNIISNFIGSYLGVEYYSLGASGAIAAIIILAIMIHPFSFTHIFIIPIPIFMLGWLIILSDIIGLTNPSQTNNLAHIGGYLSLVFLGFFLNREHKKKIIIGLGLNLLMLIILYFIINYFQISFAIGIENIF